MLRHPLASEIKSFSVWTSRRNEMVISLKVLTFSDLLRNRDTNVVSFNDIFDRVDENF